MTVAQRTLDELTALLPRIAESPRDGGSVDMIVARPAVGERRELEVAEIDLDVGLVGDNWRARGNRRTADGSADPEAQLTVINTRVVDAVAVERERWQLAGDQLVVDLDLSHDNLPPGSRVRIGTALLEFTAAPHTGCVKYADRFGTAALRFVSGAEAMRLRLRGANARVVEAGLVRVGDLARKA